MNKKLGFLEIHCFSIVKPVLAWNGKRVHFLDCQNMMKKPVYFLELPNMTKQFNVIEKLQSLRQHGKSKEGAEREQGRVAG